MQSETFGREMWGGGIDEKEPSNPFLQKRSLRAPWHGRPPHPRPGPQPYERAPGWMLWAPRGATA